MRHLPTLLTFAAFIIAGVGYQRAIAERPAPAVASAPRYGFVCTPVITPQVRPVRRAEVA